MRLLRFFFVPVLALFAVGAAAPQAVADAEADLAKYSAFPHADLESLGGGQVLTARGPALGAPRDLSVQALYAIREPLQKTLEFHKQWDATRHPELKVFVHRDLPAHPSPADFNADAPGNSAVRALTEATLKLPDKGGLQMNDAEAKAFHGGDTKGSYPPAVRDFWSQLLHGRASKFADGSGIASQPEYDTPGGAIRPADEVTRLLKEQPNVLAMFRPIIGGGISGGSPYWEMFDVEGQANFLLGAATSKTSGETAQILDLQYYASGGYYAYVTLYQMWAVTIGGKPATLVWRVDCLSSQDIADLSNVEKMGSGSAMMKEVLRTIQLTEKDAAR